MRASADRLGLAVHVVEIASKTWLEVVRSKVQFLISQRRDFRGPLLYVDVDAVFHSDPWIILGDINTDVAFALLLDNKARSGTIYLADTAGAKVFLEDWEERLQRVPDAWDQHPLTDIARDAVEGTALGYRWHNLPSGLCYIFDRAEKTAGVGVLPVIEHLQASREMRDPTSVHCLRRRARVRAIDKALSAGNGPLS